ncbi:YjbH domain-containing protein [Desulfurobacterium atlanticum]|uniref:Exopolysaccharide biosynthesis protein YbjH n=1 Tax=Desulfurobacterium atlanticum TaxID=240169 RepID=A0A239A8Z3_9BACT|nr:YjbH domain-containing protein [Desulfurobacterium atlanticum]SNR92030.1 Exopolysaccharide biosynthesis protein YbjH [Desulfurobacterium atlanticum]
MKTDKLFLTVLTIGTFVSNGPAHGAYRDPVGEFGVTGYLFTPSAYIQQKRSVTPSFSFNRHYKSLGLNTVILPGLETAIRYNIENNEDKDFLLKYQFLPETDRYPAIAFGGSVSEDALSHGFYISISKYFETFIPQTFTVGYGSGIYNGFFTGAELLFHPKFTILIEYANFREKTLKTYMEKPDSDINVGIKIMPFKNLQITGYYLTGNTAGGNISYTFKF